MNILYTTDSNRHNILIPIEEIATRDNTDGEELMIFGKVLLLTLHKADELGIDY